jgi:hypothetical protein
VLDTHSPLRGNCASYTWTASTEALGDAVAISQVHGLIVIKEDNVSLSMIYGLAATTASPHRLPRAHTEASEAEVLGIGGDAGV